MKKKTIILVICALSWLLLTSWSYGGFDPRYVRLQAHPWQELFSAPHPQDTTSIVLKKCCVVIIIPIVRDCLIFTRDVNTFQSSKGGNNNLSSLKIHK
jgi:hypothetical protein